MRYVGSKRTIAKYIVPFLLRDIQENTIFYDVFCGGCNIIDHLYGKRVANDSNKYLIAFYNEYVYNDFQLPKKVNEEFYYNVKNNKDNYHPALVGYIGFMYSYRCKWFSSYDNGCSRGRKESGETAKNILERQRPCLKGTIFISGDYKNVHIGSNNIVYCDPPYENASHSKELYRQSIDKKEFIAWCKEVKSHGNKIFISEYDMPAEFKCVIEIPKTTTLSSSNNKKSIEKLFVLE